MEEERDDYDDDDEDNDIKKKAKEGQILNREARSQSTRRPKRKHW